MIAAGSLYSELFTQRGLEKLAVGTYLLHKNSDSRELHIMLAGRPMDSASGCELLSFWLMSPDVEDDQREPDGVCKPVRLKVDAQFLPGAEATIRGSMRNEEELVLDSTAVHLADGLVSTKHSNPLGARIEQCAAALLCERLANVLASTFAHGKRFQQWQLAIIERALAEDHHNLSVTEMAERCGLSSCHFSRLFKATFGMPLHRYTIRARIQKAQQQLSRTDDPIAQIALDCGFADQCCFTRRFTTVAGIPPALWRRQNRPAARETQPSHAWNMSFATVGAC